MAADYLNFLSSPYVLKQRLKKRGPSDAAIQPILDSFVDPELAKQYSDIAIRGARAGARRVARKGKLKLGERELAEMYPLKLRATQLTGEMGAARTAAGKAELEQKLQLGLSGLEKEYGRKTSRAKSGHSLQLARLRASKDTGSSTWPNILAAAALPISFASGYADIKSAQATRDYNRWLASIYGG